MTQTESTTALNLRKILYATDFSSAAEGAGLYAQAIAKQYSSTLHLVHVVDLSAAVQMPDAGVCIAALREDAAGSLRRVKAELGKGIKVKVTLTEGFDPANVILQIARDESADLIVCGTRGFGALARWTLGSTAQQLIHHAKHPVLTIGPEVAVSAAPGRFQRAVYAADFSPEAAQAAAFALSFAQDCAAHLDVCYVLPKPEGGQQEDVVDRIAHFAAVQQGFGSEITRALRDPECTVEQPSAAESILLLAQRVKADLIIVGTRRLSGWFDNLKAEVAYEVARGASCPVLTVCR